MIRGHRTGTNRSPGGGSISGRIGIGTGAEALLSQPRNCRPGIQAREDAEPPVFAGIPGPRWAVRPPQGSTNSGAVRSMPLPRDWPDGGVT